MADFSFPYSYSGMMMRQNQIRQCMMEMGPQQQYLMSPIDNHGMTSSCPFEVRRNMLQSAISQSNGMMRMGSFSTAFPGVPKYSTSQHWELKSKPTLCTLDQESTISSRHREINRLSAARSRMRKKMRQSTIENKNETLKQRNLKVKARIKVVQNQVSEMRKANHNLLRSNKELLQIILSNIDKNRNLNLRDVLSEVSKIGNMRALSCNNNSSDMSRTFANKNGLSIKLDPGGSETKSWQSESQSDEPSHVKSLATIGGSIAGFFKQSLNVLAAVASVAKWKSDGQSNSQTCATTSEDASMVDLTGQLNVTMNETTGTKTREDLLQRRAKRKSVDGDPWDQWLGSMWHVESKPKRRKKH